MATWPENGDKNWNTKMKANIDVGHDAGGTHKKSQMLIDMEWSPTSYTGGENSTLPNGLIIKVGTSDSIAGAANATITFGSAFSDATYKVTLGKNSAISTNSFGCSTGNKAAGSFKIYNNGGTTSTFDWIAIGH
ncbi:hypothetical protein LCGC14_0622120 [marine sediment metagenome]|uniref:Putative tail fiber protein gp53-like C-terminal domain-containing protein n=1 Tax=marine sediment metagenome TaxID=412755 RepID=A0A0F9R4L8_9ZZZZ